MKIKQSFPFFQKIFQESSSKAFSLVELLTVIGILGILAVIAIPAYQNYKEASYDTWVKNELTDQSRYLNLAHSVDGGFHQILWTMGYRPSRPLLGNAGFKNGYSGKTVCCNRYPADTGSGVPQGLFTYYKGKDGRWAHDAHSICSKPYRANDKHCPDQMGHIMIDEAVTDNGITLGSECSYDLANIECDCDHFLILGVTAHGKKYVTRPTAQSAVNNDGARVFLLDHKGKLCSAEKNRPAEKL